ncbi:MAG: NAD(P)-dependent oxidoreductase [Pseudonocardiaceae bacterium]|nr:MAG: NAD(P)-dependent oxidoreductase [Pseudonocardiaceae bacterium]
MIDPANAAVGIAVSDALFSAHHQLTPYTAHHQGASVKLFVTGGTGFIGSALVSEALEAGHELALLTREPAAWRLAPFRGKINIIPGSLSDVASFAPALNALRPDCVAHLGWAGVAGADRNNPKQISNIDWSCRLLLAAREAGAKAFISTGSQAEYGPKRGIISPDEITEPTTLYGECKLATFRLLNQLSKNEGMRFAWLRVFSTYGPADHPYWMIPTLIGTLLRGKKPVLTACEQRWDYLHVADAARAILAACESEAGTGVFNLGSGSSPLLRDTVSFIRDQIDPQLPLGFGEIPYRPDQVMHLEADTTRLAHKLGWRPRVALADGLAETVVWYRDNSWIFVG